MESVRVNSRNRYRVKLNDRTVLISNYTTRRVKGKSAIVETKNLYQEQFSARIPVLKVWIAFGVIYDPANWPIKDIEKKEEYIRDRYRKPVIFEGAVDGADHGPIVMLSKDLRRAFMSRVLTALMKSRTIL